MKIHVSHLSRYEYSREVSFSPHQLYMRPRETPLLKVNRFTFNISPEAKVIWTRDAHDNLLAHAHFWERASALSIRSDFEVETLDANPFDFIIHGTAARFPFSYDGLHTFNLAPYLAPPFNDTQAALREWLDERFFNPPVETVPYLVALNNLLHDSLRYERREEHGIQPSLTTLQLGSGSCRDYAVLFIELCRTLGIAARYVSGYHYGPGADSPSACSMHAWAEVYLPGAGWKGIDPTHGIFCDDSFVPVAHAAVAEMVTPVNGSYYSSDHVPHVLTTSVLVERVA